MFARLSCICFLKDLLYKVLSVAVFSICKTKLRTEISEIGSAGSSVHTKTFVSLLIVRWGEID